MAIERLMLVDSVTGSTFLAVSVNGQDYRAAASALLAYMQDNLAFPDSGFVTQYAAPSATGFSVQIGDGDVHLILTPTAGFAAGTLVLPAIPVDGQQVLVNCTQAVTTLTIDGNGATVTGAPTTLAANAFFTLKYDAPTGVWYRIN